MGSKGKSGKTTERIRENIYRFHQNLLFTPSRFISGISSLSHPLNSTFISNIATNLDTWRTSCCCCLNYSDSAPRFAEMPAYARCRVCGFAVAARCRLNGKAWLSRRWNKHYLSRPEVWCFGLKMDERISGGIICHRPAHSLSLFSSPGIEINYFGGSRWKYERRTRTLSLSPGRGRGEGQPINSDESTSNFLLVNARRGSRTSGPWKELC